MAVALLVADHLTRTFDGRVAVRDVSLAVNAGEVVTLLGPNGAGKTTIMRMLAGLILPTAGRISINQVELTERTSAIARSAIGLLTEAPGLWERLTVSLNLMTYARLHGLDDPRQRVSDALRTVDLLDRTNDVAGTLSKGLKQRVAIARALLHRPPVLLLDEPTSGLDPASARHVRDLISGLRQQGRAILVSTHNLVEAEELSDRIAILHTSLLAVDTAAALRESVAGALVVIEVEGSAGQWLPAMPAGATASGGLLSVRLRDVTEIPDLVSRLVGAGARIVRVAPERRSLEDVYLELVGADR